MAKRVAVLETSGGDMITHERVAGGWLDQESGGCCTMLLPGQSEDRLADDSIEIDEPLRNSIVETEIEVKKRLGKLRSRVGTVTTQIAFDFSPFLGEADRYVHDLEALKDRPAIGRDDPHLALVLDSKALGRRASEAASYLMTHATELESRTRHDLLSDLWLVNLAHELSQTLRTKVDEQTKVPSGPRDTGR